MIARALSGIDSTPSPTHHRTEIVQRCFILYNARERLTSWTGNRNTDMTGGEKYST